MQIEYATLETCAAATGAVVIIDVVRAMTTAAFAFAAGARDIIPVSTIEEALALRERFPGALAMGEVGALPPEGFDLGNSPSALVGRDLGGKRLIQRTGAGTQGIVRCAGAEMLLGTGFVCAEATVRSIRRQSPDHVTLVSTGPDGEDQACAEYIAARLRDETPNPGAFLNRVRDATLPRLQRWVSRGMVTEAQQAEFLADIDCCATLDRFNFAMVVRQRGGLLVMEAVQE